MDLRARPAIGERHGVEATGIIARTAPVTAASAKIAERTSRPSASADRWQTAACAGCPPRRACRGRSMRPIRLRAARLPRARRLGAGEGYGLQVPRMMPSTGQAPSKMCDGDVKNGPSVLGPYQAIVRQVHSGVFQSGV